MADGAAKGLSNLAIRVVTAAARFVLLLGIARFLRVEALGVFGLLSVTLHFAVQAVGLELYAVAHRELLEHEAARWPAILRTQAAGIAGAYLLLSPLALLVFAGGFLPWWLCPWLFALLILEHANWELSRLLPVLSRPLRGSVAAFCRSGAWVLVVLPLMWLEPSLRRLEVVLGGWVAGALVGVVVGSRGLVEIELRAVVGAVDWRAVRSALAVAAGYLVVALSTRAMVLADRYFIKASWGDAEVGVYSLFHGISSFQRMACDAAVVAILLPRVVQSYRRGDLATHEALLRRVGVGVALVNGAAVVGLALFLGPLLAIVGQPEYAAATSILWLLVAGAAVATLGLVPSLSLYARGQDRLLVACALAGLGVALALDAWLVPEHGGRGAAIASLAAATVVSAGWFGGWWWVRRGDE